MKPREFVVVDPTDNSGLAVREMNQFEREFFYTHGMMPAVNTFYVRQVLPAEVDRCECGEDYCEECGRCDPVEPSKSVEEKAAHFADECDDIPGHQGGPRQIAYECYLIGHAECAREKDAERHCSCPNEPDPKIEDGYKANYRLLHESLDQYNDSLEKEFMKLQDENEKLQSQLASAKRDSERLGLMIREGFSITKMGDNFGIWQCDNCQGDFISGNFKTAREAIDSKMDGVEK